MHEPARYSHRYRFEHTSEGGSDVYDVIDETRSVGDPVATCYSPGDAMMIADLLNELALGRLASKPGAGKVDLPLDPD